MLERTSQTQNPPSGCRVVFDLANDRQSVINRFLVGSRSSELVLDNARAMP
jgi:hypothetical protein